MMHVFLDSKRFPSRQNRKPILPRAPFGLRMEWSVLVRWARHLNIHPNDLFLFATAQEAMNAAVRAVMAPTDVALVARPMDEDWLTAVLAIGARYVDVGRRFDGPTPVGGWHRPAAERAAAAHDEAIAIVESPIWSGADDVEAIAGLPLRAVVIDARRTEDCWGAQVPAARKSLTLIALRDPDQPCEPLVCGLVVPTLSGVGLRVAVGPTRLPRVIADRATAVLHSLALQPDWPAPMLAQLQVRYAAWHAAMVDRPGVQVLGRCGLEAAALCHAGDGPQIADAIATDFPSIRASRVAGMRGLLTVDLLS